MNVAAGLLLAVASAAALNWGFFVQHGAARTLPRLSLAHPLRSSLTLFADLRWLVGYLVGWVGWGLYIAALHFAPLSIVQGVSAGGLGLLALLVHVGADASLSHKELAAALASIAGLAMLGASLVANVPSSRHVGWQGVAVTVAAVLGAGFALLGLLWRLGAAAFALGAMSGLAYAAGDVATKGALGGSGLAFIPVLLACHLLGFIAIQLAFQRGGALSTAGASTLLTNAVPIVAGIALFREHVPSGAPGALRVAGFLLVLFAAVLLARTDEEPGVQLRTS